MKSTTYIGLAALLAFAFGAAWKLGGSPRVGRAPVKNLTKEGDLEGTLTVGRQLVAELAEKNWDWKAVNQNLLKVPDQYNFQFAPEGEGMWTWAPCTQPEYQNEVAFFSQLYTWREFNRVPGIEGRLKVTGSYIVGWKDGRVETVPVSDVRLYPSSQADTYLYVFPGMDEYDADLPRDGDPDFSAKLARYRQKTALLKK